MEQLRVLLHEFGGGVWRRRWLSVAAAWLICVGGWVGVFMIPNQYESSARLYVNADAVLTPLLKGIALDDTPEAQLDTLQRTLLSRPNLEKLISQTDLELGIRDPADLERMTKNLASQIKVTLATRNLFTISYRSSDPKLAYDVVRTVLSIFVESKTGTNRTDMENAQKFINQQIASYEQKLREAESKRAEFRSRYIDLLPSDQNGGQSRLEQARTTLTQLQGQLTDEKRRLALLQQELSTAPAQIGADTPEGAWLTGGGGDSQLQQAEQNLQALQLKFTDNNPDVIAARNLVDALRKRGSRGAAPAGHHGFALANPLYTQTKSQIFDSQARVSSLERQVADETKACDRMEEIARGAPGLQAEYTDLERGYDVLRKDYEELLARRESMRLADAANTDAGKVTTRVVDPPTVPQLAVTPNRPLLLAGVLLMGLGAALALPVLLQQFDASMHNVEQLRQLELPVLGSVSLIEKLVPLRRRMFDVVSLAMASLVLLAMFGGLLVHTIRIAA
jgi:polysaccharide chain length determinant protein (PEP-CTERM system associated)